MIKFVLFILSLIYGLVIKLLMAFCERRQYQPACKVISVGNITVGGTGKTPLVEYIAKRLKENGHSTAVVTRGYKRKITDYGLRNTDDGIRNTEEIMPKKILVIDDEPELVKAIKIRLKASGYEVEVAYDGLTGINKVKETKPDLILLDIRMPGMDGYEVSRKLKADLDTKDIPIVIFTVSQEKDLEKKCKEVGVTDYIMKPFETKDLLVTVNKFFKNEKT